MTPHRAQTAADLQSAAAFGPGAQRPQTWRHEDGVFAADELGWLAEQARRRLNLELGWPDGPALLHDLHLRDESFRRLATHPRLLTRAERLIGAPVAIAATALFAGDDIRLPSAFLAADVLVVVPLAARHPAKPGGAGFGTRLPEATRHDWPFLVALRRAGAAERPTAPVADDALWPDAASVAG
jgi:hypothetical protein